MKKNYGALLTIASLGIVLLATSVCAQPQPKYKEGDRVEVDIIEATNPASAIWKKGTITKVDLSVSSMAYTVEVDPVPGRLPQIVHVPIRPYAEGWLHPLGGAAPKTEADKLRVDDNDTV